MRDVLAENREAHLYIVDRMREEMRLGDIGKHEMLLQEAMLDYLEACARGESERCNRYVTSILTDADKLSTNPEYKDQIAKMQQPGHVAVLLHGHLARLVLTVGTSFVTNMALYKNTDIGDVHAHTAVVTDAEQTHILATVIEAVTKKLAAFVLEALRDQ